MTSHDELGQKLVDLEFVPNTYLLDINGTLTVPRDMPLPAPWNLPSRLFRFPVEVSEMTEGQGRRIGLMHPLLGEHPFVVRLVDALGVPLAPDGAPNRHGVSRQRTAQWWHAVDLVSAGQWHALIETRRFTTDRDIASAVTYGLDYSPADGPACGYLSVLDARAVMKSLDAPEPRDRVAVLQAFSAPTICRQDRGQERRPIHRCLQMDENAGAWGRILGIEHGWFKHDSAGFLGWTELGRERHAAGDSLTFTEQKTGQGAFSF